MKSCECGSYAINPGMDGRGTDSHGLCDVCYWKAKWDALRQENAQLSERIENVCVVRASQIDPETRRMVLELCEHIEQYTHPKAIRDDAAEIKKRMEG